MPLTVTGKSDVKLSDLGEQGLIQSLSKMIPCSKNIPLGIGDDTAVLPFFKDRYLLVTTDMLLEDEHFRENDDPKLIGHKALACNLSDIAAMGGEPKWAVVSIGVDCIWQTKKIHDVYRGMKTLARKFCIDFVGGDTIRSERLIINVAVMGTVKKNQCVLRSTAKHADHLFVTGPLGGAIRSGKHLNFTPRLKEAKYLVEHFRPSAMIDISDGLLTDCGHMATQSKLGAIIFEDFIPLNRNSTMTQALREGEDYELLFAMNPQRALLLQRAKKPFRFYPIGVMTKYLKGINFYQRDGCLHRIKDKAFSHF